MCCAILFPAGPEAVLCQPLENMKAWVSGGAWVQPGEGCTWTPLAHNPSSYMTRCMFCIQIFYFSRVSWLRRPSWVPYPLPYPDPSLFTRAFSRQFFPQKFWVKSESTPVFLSKNLSLERKIVTNLNSRQKCAFRTSIELSRKCLDLQLKPI